MPKSWDEREDDFEYKPVRQSAKGIIWIGVLVVVALIVFGGIGVLLWGTKVGTSDIKGQGDAEITKNEAGNRIRAQEGFLDKFNAIITADKNLTLTAEALKSQPDSVKLQTELTGQKMICNDAVGAYNSAARKFTQQEFRDADLPDKIDETKSETDCKETMK